MASIGFKKNIKCLNIVIFCIAKERLRFHTITKSRANLAILKWQVLFAESFNGIERGYSGPRINCSRNYYPPAPCLGGYTSPSAVEPFYRVEPLRYSQMCDDDMY